jgi:hypothetical protein
MKLTGRRLAKLVKEEVERLFEIDTEYTLNTEDVQLFKEVLQRAKLDDVLQRLEAKNKAGSVFVTISLSKEESELIAKTINEMLNVTRIGYNTEEEKRKLEGLLNGLPYLDTFLEF